MERLNVNPNRMELSNLKEKLTTAEQGHDLLKGKQDELVHQFIDLLYKSRKKRRSLEKQFQDLYNDFALVGAIISPEALEEALMAPSTSLGIHVREKTIMGVSVPEFQVASKEEKVLEYPYGFASTSSELDTSLEKCSDMMEDIIELAQMEKSCDLLADEIEKVRRRVNALEFMTIPQLHESIRYIQMKLDENERGNLVRLIKVKNKLKAAKQ